MAFLGWVLSWVGVVISVVLFMAVSCVYGEPVPADSVHIFKNEACEKTKTCDLLEFKVMIHPGKVLLREYNDEAHYGTMMTASYRTTAVADLPKYAVVNFIRGCIYNTHPTHHGLVREFARLKGSSEGPIPFLFKDWSLDSYDADPMFNSNIDPKKGSRHYFYLWNSILGSYDTATEHLFGKQRPSVAELYVRDLGSDAFLMESEKRPPEAFNNSLEFNTCLYRTVDIPSRIQSLTDIHFATPLDCHHWWRSQVYDHKEKKFTFPESIQMGPTGCWD